MSYTLPQVQVFQEVSQIPTAVVANLNPFTYGANYSLRRYAEASEKAIIGLENQYSPDAGNTEDYPGLISGSVVDASYVKVYAEDAWLKYKNVPESATSPLMCTSADSRNKLRAAPRVTSAQGADPGSVTTVRGYHTGTVELPEAYYFTPAEKFTVGTTLKNYNYVTSEGLSGTVAVPTFITSTLAVQGPDGLVLTFAAGAVLAPRSLTFASAEVGKVGSFTLSLVNTEERIRTRIDGQVAATRTLAIVRNGSPSVPGTPTADLAAGGTLTIKYDATCTLAGLRAAIQGAVVADADFVCSAVALLGTGAAISTNDTVNSVELTAGTTVYKMVPDCVRAVIYENQWIFKTANDITRSAVLLKDVEVGDKVFWQVTPASTGLTINGWSAVAALEADYSRATVGDAEASSDNQADYAPEALPSTTCGIPSSTNSKSPDFSTANITVAVASATIGSFVGSLSAGILHDTFIVTITTGGIAGLAKATVSSGSGTYLRTNVPIEVAAGASGKIYLGGNVKVTFATLADPAFELGDSYTIGDTVAGLHFAGASFAAIDDMASGGTYTGTVDDIYQIEVIRGGMFVRTATTVPGLTAATFAGDGLVPAVDEWIGGDVDDEYVLECTTAGPLSTAKFKLSSQRSDTATSIMFVTADAYVTVGSSGLKLKFSGEPTSDSGSFVVGQYWIVLVRASRPRVRVTDSAGVDQESTVNVTAGGAITVGLNGVTLTFIANTNTFGLTGTSGGLITGDVFTIETTASAPSAVQTLVLADDLPSSITCGENVDGTYNYAPDVFSADLCLVRASKSVTRENEDPAVAAGGYNWTTGASQITLESGITLQDSAWVDPMGTMPFIPLVHADLYVEYRSLLLTYSDALYSLSDITLVESQLGPAVEDNPLSLAVYSVLENTGARTAYFTAIHSDNLAGDGTALSKASLVSNIWAFNPAGITDPARHDLLEAHINSMSTEIKKRWRAGFIGRELPSVEAVLTAATNPNHVAWQAVVGGTGNKRVTLSQTGALLTALHVGDEIRLGFETDAWDRVTYTTDYVASISSNTMFYLENGLAAPVATNAPVEAYHNRSTPEVAAACKAIAEGYGNKRMYVCFPGNLGKFGPYVNAAYGAASVAGLVASVAPQQGLTNVELNGYDDVPYSYGMFSYDELNTIAEGGTLIIMQDIKAGSVYVRHQISTAYKDGNLNTTELSMVKNLDSISYYFSDLLRPFIGRYNVTPQLVSVLRTQIQDGLNYLGSLTGVGLLGPQVILENGLTKIRTLEQHPTLKDRVVAIVDIELPAPLNVIELHIVV